MIDTLKPLLTVFLLTFIPISGAVSRNASQDDTANLITCGYARIATSHFNPGGSGAECLWDLSALDRSGSSLCITQITDSLGHSVIMDGSKITYYIMRKDTLLEIGNESPMMETSYLKPIVTLRYPMALGDSLSRPFEGFGIYCGDHYYKEKGVSSYVVDGRGELILSETDTLKNVLRVYRVKSYSVAMDINPAMIDSSKVKQVIEERYQWYAQGVSHPILETVMSTSYDNMSPIGTTQYGYYAIPDSILPVPPSTAPQDENGKEDNPTPVIHYHANVNGNILTVNFDVDAEANITMILANHMGMVYDSRKLSVKTGAGYQTSFDIGSLHPGFYILYINVNGTIYSEKVRI